ncbi:MAG: TonB-dependent receptor [Gammaproteobacteria bacterium]|nr:TonB-dependent receptor [Gammaproteobacteria bacterium]
MNKLLNASTLAICCASPCLIQANDKMEEVIVTSSRIEMPLRQIGTAVSVVTDQEIKQQGLISLADILRTTPSVAVSRNGGPGSTTGLRIRGEEGFRTLVLIDGMDISDAAGTQVGPNFENLLSTGISRIEILRGTQGMMYGADAGGIVNIQSYLPEEGLGGEVSAEGGRYDTHQFAAALGGKSELGDFSLTAADYQTDGYNARDTDTILRDDDGYENTTLHGRVAWNATKQLRLQLTARDVDSDNDFDSCFNADFEEVDLCSNTFEQTGWRASADYKGERLSHSLSYSSTDTDREFFSEGVSSFYARGELEKYEYLGSFTASESTRFLYGADLKRESIDDGTFNQDRDQTGLYAEYHGSFSDRLFITAGGRYDDNDDFGDFTSWRASAAYLIDTSNGTVKLKSSYGTGFRAPSLYEISYNNSFFAFPPASTTTLKEEKSRGFDLGVEYYANGGMHLEAVYFDQTVKDEIFFDQADFSGYLQGRGDTDSRGVELVAELPLAESWYLSGNYTYNDTENSSGSSRIRRPEHLANLALRYHHASGKFTAQLNARGGYHAIDIDGSSLDEYEVINLSASFTLTPGLQVYGRVENLLDKDYQEVLTYNASGIAGYAGVRYSF